VVLVRLPCGRRTQRVDDDHPPAAPSDLPEPTLDSGSGHEPAVRFDRVRTDDEHVKGPVDVGNGDEVAAAVQPVARELSRQLIEGVRAEAGSRAHRIDELVGEQQRTEVVHHGLPEIGRDAALAVPFPGPDDSLGRQVEGLLPRNGLPLGAPSPQRSAQPIRIFVQVAESDGLRADVAPAQRVELVAANGADPPLLQLHLDAAARFTQGAGAIHDLLHGYPPGRLATGIDPGPLRARVH
jgi:hypothetical protein